MHQKRSPLYYLLLSLAGLLLLATLIGFFAATSYKGGPVRAWNTGSKKLTMDHIFNGTFWAERKTLRWVPEGCRNP
jgi:dipeptidyl aminopeptidase